MNQQVPFYESHGQPPQTGLSMAHAQRLFERWLRRWGYALSGCLLGLGASWGIGAWVWPEVGERHVESLQNVARLQTQLAALAVVVAPSSAQTLAAPRGLDRLPAHDVHGQIWIDWQHVLHQHGLRLLSLQPVNAIGSAAVGSENASSGPSATLAVSPSQSMPLADALAGPRKASVSRTGLSSQTAALQIEGRFEDWARLWAACAEWGPVCAIERIKVEATPVPGQVQIDVLLRLQMRAGHLSADSVSADNASAAREPAGAGAARGLWLAMANREPVPSALPSGPLFRPLQLTAEVVAVRPDMGAPVVESEKDSAALALANADLTSATQALPPDPDQWPLARVRWHGLWQQGANRWAIVSAGAHWAKVGPGQQVTSEGHRVEAITEEGMHLRLPGEPPLKLNGANPSIESPKRQGEQR
jgi:hypothetical protein